MGVASHTVVGSGRSPDRRSEEQHALIERILRSRQFERSNRLRQFLIYVCERSFEDSAGQIHEQEIGHAVFGRSADYDTNQDNIVRVTASQVRRKLEQFFASEGISEPLILQIPKGQYVPVFNTRDIAPSQVRFLEEPARLPVRQQRPRTTVLLACSTAVLAVCTVWLAIVTLRQRAALRADVPDRPVLNALWSQLLPPSGRTDIVVCDSSLSLFQELLDRQLTLSEYLQPDIWTQARSLSSDPRLQAFAQRAAQRRFTSLASVTSVYRIAQLAARDPSRASIFSAREFNIRELKFDNVILLGSTRANPWLELLQDRLNFRFGFDQAAHHSYFENHDRHPGELARYPTDSTSSYCDIAFLPNLAKTGNVLVLAGTEVEGTEGGAEFVTDEHSLEQLLQYVTLKPRGKLPYFEVLLKSKRIDGAARGSSIVAFRSPQL
ncbi:MAG: hypothetical protein JOZ62_02620 [Acidobacteriaceae bacterium]|nr:hypothetical protein [Acidobacteriaceae bacterium]